MRKILAGLFLALFLFQAAAFAGISSPVSGTVSLVQKAAGSVMQLLHLTLQKLDLAS